MGYSVGVQLPPLAPAIFSIGRRYRFGILKETARNVELMYNVEVKYFIVDFLCKVIVKIECLRGVKSSRMRSPFPSQASNFRRV